MEPPRRCGSSHCSAALSGAHPQVQGLSAPLLRHVCAPVWGSQYKKASNKLEQVLQGPPRCPGAGAGGGWGGGQRTCSAWGGRGLGEILVFPAAIHRVLMLKTGSSQRHPETGWERMTACGNKGKARLPGIHNFCKK